MSQYTKTRELRLGDVVKCFDGAFGTGVVKNNDGGWVTIFRPYVHVGSFASTNGVGCYVGVEEYKVPIESGTLWIVYQSNVVL